MEVLEDAGVTLERREDGLAALARLRLVKQGVELGGVVIKAALERRQWVATRAYGGDGPVGVLPVIGPASLPT